MSFKDFDLTQINKDTKIIVFKVPFRDYQNSGMDLLESHLKRLHDKLHNIGVTALFIDDSLSVEPLTDDLLSTNKLKTI